MDNKAVNVKSARWANSVLDELVKCKKKTKEPRKHRFREQRGR